MKKLIRASLAASAVAGLTLVGMAAPAQATTTAPTLPAGYKMVAVGCDDVSNSNIWNLDPVTGAATLIGTPSDITDPNNANSHMDCAGQGTYNPVSKKSYYVGWGAGDTWLSEANLTTGATTNVQAISDNGCVLTSDNSGNLYQWVSSGAATNSSVVNNSISNPNNSNVLETVNPDTGVITNVSVIDNAGSAFTNFSDCAFAFNPVDNMIYTFSTVTTNTANTNHDREIWKIDPTTGAATDTGHFVDRTTLTSGAFGPDSMVIDANGIAWIQDDSNTPDWGLVAVDLATGEAWNRAPGNYDTAHSLYPTADQITNSQNANGMFYQMSIWIVPTETAVAPTLASTGSDSGSLVAFAGLIALLGAATLVASRRRTN